MKSWNQLPDAALQVGRATVYEHKPASQALRSTVLPLALSAAGAYTVWTRQARLFVLEPRSSAISLCHLSRPLQDSSKVFWATKGVLRLCRTDDFAQSLAVSLQHFSGLTDGAYAKSFHRMMFWSTGQPRLALQALPASCCRAQLCLVARHTRRKHSDVHVLQGPQAI